jgi:hypothetical protein
MLHPELVCLLIALSAWRLNRRALGPIQQSKLNPSGIRIDRHLAAQRINLAHDVALGLTPNCWVATHLRDRVDIAA